ncbi:MULTISPECIES: DUF4185 domain-containing protein [unclassified Mycolicibacterium]|uniref:DUF4185 domain-containing protein n=1 Tax=unclassified Mycolicibacterium TaxID=2636767 RepID=UPI002815EAA3|nr:MULTISPECIES: DUF4185 domain-containing protein [unclassified Mycolicibacterium]MUM05826.1 hypothetical protein [Mycolicibacterium sp. CBMA 213]
MSPRPRLASLVLTTAVVCGGAVYVAPLAVAEPCPGAAGGGGVMSPPMGHRPGNANDKAPLPNLGRLSRSLIGAIAQGTGTLQQQAAAVPGRPRVPQPQVPQQQVAQPAPAQTPPQPAADPAPAIDAGTTSLVGWVTGDQSAGGSTLQRFGISGTDLGIMWDNGDPANNQVLMMFGDTYGNCSASNLQWRYNTMFRTNDRTLSHGISVPPGSVSNPYSGSPEWQPGISKQTIPTIRWAPVEKGIIPTSGIAVGKTQYASFMSIKNWDNAGSWTTNYSAIAVSNDNGQNWGVYPSSVRPMAPGDVQQAQYAPGNENFQQGAFLKGNDGYIYVYGTPPGRSGSGYISRVPANFLPDLSKYQYWSNDSQSWVPNNPGAASPVIPGPVGEMSVQYNTYLKQYLVMYCNNMSDVVFRTSPTPVGPWSPERLVVSAMQFPGGVYAPFLHPWSTGRDLYFNLSLWSAYNVMLLHTVLP